LADQAAALGFGAIRADAFRIIGAAGLRWLELQLKPVYVQVARFVAGGSLAFLPWLRVAGRALERQRAGAGRP
jgi:hypothetical protein